MQNADEKKERTLIRRNFLTLDRVPSKIKRGSEKVLRFWVFLVERAV